MEKIIINFTGEQTLHLQGTTENLQEVLEGIQQGYKEEKNIIVLNNEKLQVLHKEATKIIINLKKITHIITTKRKK